MKTAHQNVPYPQVDQEVANKKYVDDNAGGGGTTLVFRPGSGNSGPIVWGDFNELYDNALSGALTNGGGQCTVLIDDGDESPAVLDPGPGNISYDFTGVRLVGIDPQRQVPLDVINGSGESDTLTITGASYFEGLNIRSIGNDTAFDAQNDQEITLKRTTFNGAGEYIYDFISTSGCVLYMDDESRMQRTSNAAIRVNGVALTIYVNGNRAVIDNLGVAGFVGGSVDIIIGSSSARVDKQQDILLQTFTMSAAAGFWNGDPNTKLSAGRGTIVVDEITGNQWKNTDGSMAWTAIGGALLIGSTPGSGPGESVELGSGALLQNDKAYTIVVSAVARGSVSGSPCMQSFRQTFAARREAGTSVIAASGVLEQLGDAASSSWTLVASIGAGPDRFRLVFNTGATTSAVNVVAKVEMTEVQNP